MPWRIIAVTRTSQKDVSTVTHINSCEGGFCRAYLNAGHQCHSGETMACSISGPPAFTGTVTCSNGAWGACVASISGNASITSESPRFKAASN